MSRDLSFIYVHATNTTATTYFLLNQKGLIWISRIISIPAIILLLKLRWGKLDSIIHHENELHLVNNLSPLPTIHRYIVLNTKINDGTFLRWSKLVQIVWNDSSLINDCRLLSFSWSSSCSGSKIYSDYY